MVGRADKGLIITTGTFTPEARREATRDGAPAIDLVDGDGLCDLLKELKLGVTIRLVEEVEVNPSYFLQKSSDRSEAAGLMAAVAHLLAPRAFRAPKARCR